MIEPVATRKTAAALIDSGAFFARARSRLTFDVPRGLTDAALTPTSGDAGTDRMWDIIAQERPLRPAAVLIPVIAHDEPTVLLTMRAAHLNDHAGQIAFPGGKIDPSDASPRDAALREAEEEVGLDRAFVDPIGYLDLYATGFGFRILPTVARVRPGFALRINHSEVDDAFEVPLSFLMDPNNHQTHSKVFRGAERSYYAMPFAERYIWGRDRGHPAGAVRTDLRVMIRPVFTEVGLFLVPFAVYALFLLATRSGVLDTTSWPARVLTRLALTSLALVIVSLLLLAHFSGASPNATYVPAHMENGRLVPGTDG